jgi:hypothetical protein
MLTSLLKLPNEKCQGDSFGVSRVATDTETDTTVLPDTSLQHCCECANFKNNERTAEFCIIVT